MRADSLDKAGGGLITLIRDTITFTTTDIPSTINTHNTELQMVMVHINNTKHITILQTCIYPLKTAHPRTIKQRTRTYKLHTVHHKHTTLSPHRRCERTLHSLVLVH